jgi:predicted SAM-dependent methyltransferase
MKLDIGGGRFPRDPEDYISVDKCGEPHVKALMWALPFRDGTIKEIWSSHTLEHAPMHKVPATLSEWFRVLRPGGRAIIQVPNFDYVAKYWLTGGDRAWAEAMVFGAQDTEDDSHRCAFTPGTLKADLEVAGFVVKHVDFRFNHNQETIQAVAVRP